MKKQIILLNGPSSSGKSTLAKALQNRIGSTLGLLYEVVSIDDFLPMTAEDPIYEDDVFAISADLCNKVSETLQTAPGVIIDHVITSQRIYEQLVENLGAYGIFTVRVTCPVEILRVRELARKNRCLGSAEASQIYLYPQDGYDLTVNTHEMTPEECANLICKSLF